MNNFCDAVFVIVAIFLIIALLPPFDGTNDEDWK